MTLPLSFTFNGPNAAQLAQSRQIDAQFRRLSSDVAKRTERLRELSDTLEAVQRESRDLREIATEGIAKAHEDTRLDSLARTSRQPRRQRRS